MRVSDPQLDWKQPGKIDDDLLVPLVTGLYQSGKTRRSLWEQEAKLCLMWAEGDQDTRFDRDLSSLVRDGIDAIRAGTTDARTLFEKLIPITINTIQGYIIQKIVLVMGQPATLYAQEQSSDVEDESAAKAQTRVLNWLWDYGGDPIKTRIVEALWFMFGGCGSFFIHPYWDASAGPIEQIGGKAMSQGMVCWDFPTPFDVTEPARARKLSDCGWIIHSETKSIEFLRHKYGSAADDITPDDSIDAFGPGINNTYSASDRSEEDAPDESTDRAAIHNLWRPVAPWCEEGALIVVCQDKVLHKGKHPYLHGLMPNGVIPLVKIDETPSVYFRCRSTAWQLMGLQANRNRSRSQEAAHFDKTCAPKYLTEFDLPENFFDNQDRSWKVPSPGQARNGWMAVTPPNLPPQTFVRDQTVRQDMADVTGIHDATTGRSEFSSQSGRHAAIRLEGDARRLKFLAGQLEAGIAEAGRQSLWLFHQYVPAERMIQITGRDLTVEVHAFKGTDLIPGKVQGKVLGPYEFNVKCKLTPEHDPQTTLNKTEVMTKMGYWSPENPLDRQRVNRMMGSELPPEYDREAQERRNAAVENERIIAGVEVKLCDGDTDDIHIPEHLWYSTTDRYKQAVNKKPEINKAHKEHILAHRYKKASQAAQEAQIEEEVKASLSRRLSIQADDEGAPPARPPAVVASPAAGRLPPGMIARPAPPATGLPPQALGMVPQGVA